jgi:hypothetical protein
MRIEAAMVTYDANGEKSRFVWAFPPELMREGMLLSEIPMILATSWWNNAVGALWSCSPAVQHHEAFQEGHRQLVVPEPIEEDGEHALFA